MRPEPVRLDPTRRRTILAAVMLGTILGPIDASIVNVVLPTIARSFSASLAAAQWVPMIYLVTAGSLILFFGRLGDIWGYRRVFLAGLLGFVAASVLCAAAPSMHALVGFRALQGLAAGMMTSVPLAILTGTFPPADRGRVIGIFAGGISVGLAVGPSLGGFLAAAFGWRAAFLVNLPVGVSAFAFARRVLPDLRGEPGRIDVPGAVTALGGLSSFLLSVNRIQQGGVDALAAVLLAVAVLLAASFVAIERRAPQPLVDLRLFRNAALGLGCLASVMNFMAQYVVVFVTPFFLSRVLHEEPGRVGLVLTAFPLTVLAVAPFAGALSDRIGTVALAVGGSSVCAIACLVFAAKPEGGGNLPVILGLVVFGLGTGAFQSPNNSAVMGSAPREHLGVVSSLLGTSRSVGMVLGVAAAGAVLYAAVPAGVLKAPNLGRPEAAAFSAGLRWAYAAAALFASTSALLSARRGRRDTLPADA
ncbi:MAG TPA: MFS transporter [Thermoanaerobaculia bacterium]|nr:MFS transporter [Thermoanaerobaculia bacterium]